MSTIDLHMHSTYSSDGTYTPAELVELCRAAGLTHAALADHNSVRGVAEALSAAEGSGLAVIPAVELDCLFAGVSLHLLGYGIDYQDPRFGQIEADLRRQEQAASAESLRRVRQLGIEFDDEFVWNLAYDGVITGEMIAEAALRYDTEGKNPLLAPYRPGGSRGDNPYVNFYWDICSQGKPAYVPLQFLSLAEAVGLIQAGGGVPVLAHPGLNVKEDVNLLEGIIADGVRGLEVFSSYHNPAQVAFYQRAAQARGLLQTCGSDFHGKTKPSIQLGSSECGGQAEEIIQALMRTMASAR